MCFDYINGVGAHKLLILSYHSLLIVRKPRSKLYFIAKYFIWRKMRQSPSGFVFKWRVRTLTLWKHVLFPSHQILWFSFSRPILFIVSACYPSVQFYCQWSNVVCCRIWINISHKERVLMHGHQGWNVRHGLCHIYMIYVYIWVVYSFCLFCCLFIIVTTQFVAQYKPCKPKPNFR